MTVQELMKKFGDLADEYGPEFLQREVIIMDAEFGDCGIVAAFMQNSSEGDTLLLETDPHVADDPHNLFKEEKNETDF